MSSVEFGLPIYGRFASVLDARTVGTSSDRPAPEDTGKGMIRTEFTDGVSTDATLVVYDGNDWVRVADNLNTPNINGDLSVNGAVYTKSFINLVTTDGSPVHWLGKIPIGSPCRVVVFGGDESSEYLVAKSYSDTESGYTTTPVVTGVCATPDSLGAHKFLYSNDGTGTSHYHLYYAGWSSSSGTYNSTVHVGPVEGADFSTEPSSPVLNECAYGQIILQSGDGTTKVLIGTNQDNGSFLSQDAYSRLECDHIWAKRLVDLGDSRTPTSDTGVNALRFLGTNESIKFMMVRGVNTGDDSSYPVKDELKLVSDLDAAYKFLQIENRYNALGVASPARPKFVLNGLTQITLKTNSDGSSGDNFQFYSDYLGDWVMNVYNDNNLVEVRKLDVKNDSGYSTHFNYQNLNMNYIRGDTTTFDTQVIISTKNSSGDVYDSTIFNDSAGYNAIGGAYTSLTSFLSINAGCQFNSCSFTMFYSSATYTGAWQFSVDGNSRLYILQPSTASGVYIDSGSSSGWITYSDIRFKKDVEEVTDCLEKVRKVRPISYRMSHEADDVKKSIGFSAQDFQEVLPEVVSDSQPERLGLSYQGVIPLLLGAVKELDAENKVLKKVLAEYDERLRKLETRSRYR